MTFTKCLADKFRSAPYEECICKGDKNMELNIKLMLQDVYGHRNWYMFEFLHVQSSLSKIDMKSLFTTIHPLMDAFIT